MRNLLKAAAKTGSGTAVNILSGILATKIMAVVLGPTGVGLFSLIRQSHHVFVNAATLGGNTALVQGIASRSQQQRERYLTTVFRFYCLGASVVAAGLVLMAGPLAEIIFGEASREMVAPIRWMAVPLVLATAVNYINGLLNGYRAIGRLALLQLLAAVTMAILAYPAAWFVHLGYPVAFVAMLTFSQLCALVYGLRVASQEGWLEPFRKKLIFSSRDGRSFFSLASATLIPGLVSIGAILAVRALIAHQGGLSEAGIFDVAWTLSMTYVMLVLNALGTYYMPALSRLDQNRERRLLICRALRFITLTMVPLITAAIVLKPLVVELLYTDEFLPALDIVRWMLPGDYLKATSWVLAIPMLSYADTRTLWWYQTAWGIGFLLMSALSIMLFDSIEGVGTVFLALYSLALVYAYCYSKNRFGFLLNKSQLTVWLVGFGIVLASSWVTWSETRVHWSEAVAWIALATLFSILALTRTERQGIREFVRKRVSRRS